MWIVWLGILVLALVVELATVNMVSIWFGLGAIAALIADVFSVELKIQIVVFFIVSIIGIIIFVFVFKPKLSKGKGMNVTTNADRILGQDGVVTVAIDPLENLGQIRVLGQIWSAVPVDGESRIDLDSLVTVVDIKGVKAVVSPSSNNHKKEN